MKVSVKVLLLILVVALVVSLVFNILQVSGSMPAQQAALNAATAIKNNLAGAETVTVLSTTEESGLYKATLSINGNDQTIYTTKDGRYLITGIVDLTNLPPPQQRVPNVSAADAPSAGSPNAPVTIIEFSDFECPYCGQFVKDTFSSLKKDYIDTGKVRFVFRTFPLVQIHPDAEKAAEAALCANDQNKFWQMHDTLFANQNALDIASLKKYAGQIGLDTAQFNTCLDSGKYHAKVQQNIADGTSYGVTGTPTFFIDGIVVSGAQQYTAFQNIINSELSNSTAQ